jgi:outer membrane protein assembly factor BamE (lipoprotein component of BamABCDE complex)
MMQKILLSALVLAFMLAQVSTADAVNHRRHGRTYHHYGVAHRYRNDDTLAGYYERRLDAVRFGSQRWWYIYDEQRGGRRR